MAVAADYMNPNFFPLPFIITVRYYLDVFQYLSSVSVGVTEILLKVVICGSPQWTYHDAVKNEIERLRGESRLTGKKLLIIHGGESGPETFAHEYCPRSASIPSSRKP